MYFKKPSNLSNSQHPVKELALLISRVWVEGCAGHLVAGGRARALGHRARVHNPGTGGLLQHFLGRYFVWSGSFNNQKSTEPTTVFMPTPTYLHVLSLYFLNEKILRQRNQKPFFQSSPVPVLKKKKGDTSKVRIRCYPLEVVISSALKLIRITLLT